MSPWQPNLDAGWDGIIDFSNGELFSTSPHHLRHFLRNYWSGFTCLTRKLLSQPRLLSPSIHPSLSLSPSPTRTHETCIAPLQPNLLNSRYVYHSTSTFSSVSFFPSFISKLVLAFPITTFESFHPHSVKKKKLNATFFYYLCFVFIVLSCRIRIYRFHFLSRLNCRYFISLALLPLGQSIFQFAPSTSWHLCVSFRSKNT